MIRSPHVADASLAPTREVGSMLHGDHPARKQITMLDTAKPQVREELRHGFTQRDNPTEAGLRAAVRG